METKQINLSERTLKALLVHPECFEAPEYKAIREAYGVIQDNKYKDSKVNNYMSSFRS